MIETIANAGALTWIAVALAGCCCGVAGDTTGEPAPATASPAAPLPSAPEVKPDDEPVGLRNTTICTHFEHDDLDQCVEMNTSVTPPEGAAEWQPSDALRERIGQGCTVLDDATPIPQPCTTQFEGRQVWATCTITQQREVEDGAHLEAVVVDRFYRLAAVEHDRDMRECLQGGGTWDAVPRDSAEYRRARLERSVDRLSESADRLQEVGGGH